MKERFLAAAAEEYVDAAAYYESREAGLGARFLEEVDQFLAIAHEFPRSGSPLKRPKGVALETRALLLRSFPIKLVYALRADTLIVIGFAHTSRRPGYWAKRLKDLP